MSACRARRAIAPIPFALAFALCVARALAADATIELTYDTTMDMVRPMAYPGVKVHHAMTVTLSAGGQVAETHNLEANGQADKFAHQATLGGGDPQAYEPVWHVVSASELVRTQNEAQSTRTITVKLTSPTTCSLEVKVELKPGFSEFAFRRIGQRAMGFFTNYRVVDSTCAIH